MAVLIGTSGFCYDDWKGYFYPSHLKKGQMLDYYAHRFRAVELNTSYYGIPSSLSLYQLAQKVPEEFRFALKAHRDMTHTNRFQPQVFAQFREALAPLDDENKLGCVLAQFPWSFKPNPESYAHLRILRAELPDVPVVVELRNQEWAKQETFDLLQSLDLGYCCVDEPSLKGLMPPVVATTSRIGYVRFHGRNYREWWGHTNAAQRYNYLYSEEELREWVPRVQEVASRAETTFVFFNNHFEGKAAQNSLDLAQILNLSLPGPPPAAQGVLFF